MTCHTEQKAVGMRRPLWALVVCTRTTCLRAVTLGAGTSNTIPRVEKDAGNRRLRSWEWRPWWRPGLKGTRRNGSFCVSWWHNQNLRSRHWSDAILQYSWRHEALTSAIFRSIVHENSDPIYSPIINPSASLRKKKKKGRMIDGYSTVSLKSRYTDCVTSKAQFGSWLARCPGSTLL